MILFKEMAGMKKATRQPLFLGTALLLGFGTLYGCKESFLTDAATPQGTVDQTTLATASGVEGNLVAAYRAIDATSSNAVFGAAASNWIYGSVVSDDAYKGTQTDDGTQVTDLETFHWGNPGGQGYLNDKWRNVFEGVNRANATLLLLKQVQKDKPTEIDAATAKAITGEATFLRGYYEFDAYKLWGNVPYLHEGDDPRKSNSTKAQVGAELLKDFDTAISSLPASPRNGQKGRATSWTAKAYKARTLMYLGQYAAALPILTDIVQNGPYALQPSFDQVWTGFEAYANGPETIFAYQASSNDGEPSGNNANFGERLTFPHSGSPFGCCGFHTVSQNMMNSFHTDANGLPTIITDPASWNTSDANMDAALGANTNLDPRVDYTAGRDNVPYKDWGVHKPDWIRQTSNGGFYSPKKNVHENASGAGSNVGWVNTQLNSVNIHLFRYADLLLLKAEAEVEVGSLENARAIVNQIRTRAGVKVQGCGLPSDAKAAAVELAAQPQCAGDTRLAVPISDPSIKWAKYKVGTYNAPWTDQAAAREMVRTERKIELALEGNRLFDLRRWGVDAAVMNAYMNGVGGGAEKTRRVYLQTADPVSAKHANYPIPVAQIDLSKSTVTGQGLTQNPGW